MDTPGKGNSRGTARPRSTRADELRQKANKEKHGKKTVVKSSSFPEAVAPYVTDSPEICSVASRTFAASPATGEPEQDIDPFISAFDDRTEPPLELYPLREASSKMRLHEELADVTHSTEEPVHSLKGIYLTAAATTAPAEPSEQQHDDFVEIAENPADEVEEETEMALEDALVGTEMPVEDTNEETTASNQDTYEPEVPLQEAMGFSDAVADVLISAEDNSSAPLADQSVNDISTLDEEIILQENDVSTDMPLSYLLGDVSMTADATIDSSAVDSELQTAQHTAPEDQGIPATPTNMAIAETVTTETIAVSDTTTISETIEMVHEVVDTQEVGQFGVSPTTTATAVLDQLPPDQSNVAAPGMSPRVTVDASSLFGGSDADSRGLFDPSAGSSFNYFAAPDSPPPVSPVSSSLAANDASALFGNSSVGSGGPFDTNPGDAVSSAEILQTSKPADDTSITETKSPALDASSLFGDSESAVAQDMFGSSSITETVANGTAPDAANLFRGNSDASVNDGVPAANKALTPAKSSPRPASDASTLFGSSSDACPFNSSPAPISTTAAPKVKSKVLSDSSSLFGGPAAESTAANSSTPVKAKVQDASTLFGTSSDAFGAPPAANVTTPSAIPRPVSNKRQVSGDASSLFGASSGASDFFSAAPAVAPSRVAPKPVSSLASPFDAAPATADAFGANAASFFGAPTNTNAFDVPPPTTAAATTPPVTSNTPTTITTTTPPPLPLPPARDTTGSAQSTPRQDASSVFAAPSDIFGQPPATTSGASASDLFSAPPPASLPTSTHSTPRAAPADMCVSQLPLKSSASASDLFSAAPPVSLPTSTHSTPRAVPADLFSSPPPAPSVLPPAPSSTGSRTASSAAATDSLFGSAPSDSLFGPPPTLPLPGRTSAPSSTGSNASKAAADSLFAAPPPAAGAAQQPKHNRAVSLNDAASLFGSAPSADMDTTSLSRSTTTNSASDLFSSQPAPPRPNSLTAPGSSSKAKVQGAIPDNLFASNPFGFNTSSTDLFAAPPPGSSKGSIDDVFNNAPVVQAQGALPAIPGVRAVYVEKKVEKKEEKKVEKRVDTAEKMQKHAAAAPPGAILTPHGFVVKPSAVAPTAAVVAADTPASKTLRKSGKYTPPNATIISFGFGGKLVMTTPNSAVLAQQYMLNQSDRKQAFPPNPVLVYSAADLLKNTVSKPDFVTHDGHNLETKQFYDILSAFPEPITAVSAVQQYLKTYCTTPISATMQKLHRSPNKFESEVYALEMLATFLKNKGVSSDVLLGSILPSVLEDNPAPLDQLLLQGKHAEAIEYCLASEHYALALLISSNVSPTAFQDAAKAYASSLPAGGTSQFAALLFSNQVDSALKFGGKKFTSSSVPSASGPPLGGPPTTTAPATTASYPFAQNSTPIIPSGVPAAPVSGSGASSWKKSVCMLLSNKMQNWEELMRVVADRIIADDGDYFTAHLLYTVGNNLPTNKSNMPLFGCPPASSKNIADVLTLHALRLTEIIEFIKSTESTTSESTLSSMFGLGGAAPRDSNSDLAKLRIYLCPVKLRLAILLCDLGFLSAAQKYAMEVKQTVEQYNTSERPKSGKPPAAAAKTQSTSPFSKVFIRVLFEFIDRLSTSSPAASSSTAGGGSSSTGSQWGLSSVWNVFSASTLKDLVDTPAPTPVAAAVPPAYANKHTVNIPERKPESEPGRGPPRQDDILRKNSHSANDLTVGTFPPPATVEPPRTMSSSHSFGDLNAPLTDYRNNIPSDHAASTSYSAPLFTPPSQPSQPAPNSAPAMKPAPSSTNSAKQEDGPQGSGIMGNVRKGLFKWLYPDAHDTSENMGKKLEATYDSATGKWIFPDDDGSAPNPAAGPPPTMPAASPMPPSSHSSNSSMPPMSSGGPPMPSTASTTPPASNDAYDPLAALMAPPARVYASTAPSISDDPLAAMMAPPMVRIPGASAAPPSSKAPPVSFKVWTPPVPAPTSGDAQQQPPTPSS